MLNVIKINSDVRKYKDANGDLIIVFTELESGKEISVNRKDLIGIGFDCTKDHAVIKINETTELHMKHDDRYVYLTEIVDAVLSKR